MARQGKYLHADALNDAIRQASDLLEDDIERVEVRGRLIHVKAGGRRLVFRVTQSQTYDPVTGAPMLGGTSGGVELVSGAEGVVVGAGWLRTRLRTLLFGR